MRFVWKRFEGFESRLLPAFVNGVASKGSRSDPRGLYGALCSLLRVQGLRLFGYFC